MTLIAFLLLLMLWVTTPMGTADGVHSAMLLQPLFSHTHLVDGRIVVHNQVDDTSTTRTTNTGPAIGAEAGASAAANASCTGARSRRCRRAAWPWRHRILLLRSEADAPSISYPIAGDEPA